MLRLGLIVCVFIAASVDRHVAWAENAETSVAAIASQLVAAFDLVFKGPYAGERAIHAKGVVVRGSFRADQEAMSLTSAQHFRSDVPPVPVIVRFSNFSGVPSQIDGRPGTNPTGMAIKFQLAGGIDTDIVAHSYNGFPVGTPEDFLAYLNALGSGDVQLRETFLQSHPAARRFFDDPKPTPVSFGTENYFGVNAFRFINAAAVSRFGRYRIEPMAGAEYLSPAKAADIKPNYLNDELRARIKAAPVRFRLVAQLASDQDVLTDSSIPWPADRPQIALGTLSLTQVVADTDPEIQTLFFSPMNLVPGIAGSADPLLAARTRSYAISYRRRQAGE